MESASNPLGEENEMFLKELKMKRWSVEEEAKCTATFYHDGSSIDISLQPDEMQAVNTICVASLHRESQAPMVKLRAVDESAVKE